MVRCRFDLTRCPTFAGPPSECRPPRLEVSPARAGSRQNSKTASPFHHLTAPGTHRIQQARLTLLALRASNRWGPVHAPTRKAPDRPSRYTWRRPRLCGSFGTLSAALATYVASLPLQVHQPRQPGGLGRVHAAPNHGLKRPSPSGKIMGIQAGEIQANVCLQLGRQARQPATGPWAAPPRRNPAPVGFPLAAESPILTNIPGGTPQAAKDFQKALAQYLTHCCGWIRPQALRLSSPGEGQRSHPRPILLPWFQPSQPGPWRPGYRP